MSGEFRRSWQAEVLSTPPLIAPARQYVYPFQVPGEEDALARGALLVMIRPAAGPAFLATFALGFRDPSMLSGLFATPHPDFLCAIAGGYAYLINTADPVCCTLLALRPASSVTAAVDAGLLLFTGFHTVLAWGGEGVLWETARLSWEGVRITKIDESTAHGYGWDLMSDREIPFTIDLRNGAHTGGSAPGAAAGRYNRP